MSTAERNRRKRERKKKARQQQEAENKTTTNGTNGNDAASSNNNIDVEIEYVAEEIQVPSNLIPNDNDSGGGGGGGGGGGTSSDSVAATKELLTALERYQENALLVNSSSSNSNTNDNNKPSKAIVEDDYNDDSNTETEQFSKRKLREQLRPTVAQLKRKVARPDLVEAHDSTAPDPEFLIQLKAIPGTVPVPRHWGRKRKYLQGKRGFEKPPFRLPDFIVATGITELRDTLNEQEAGQSAKQKNRSRVAPKLGAMDVDYRTLHDAFFKYQTKPPDMSAFGDLYYEGKELQVDLHKHNTSNMELSEKLKAALGMTGNDAANPITTTQPPPWLWNMQRYGPPPSYPNLAIPGLNAPLPSPDCQYGFHPGGWGKPPLDAYGRPMFGGNPLDPPGSKARKDAAVASTSSSGDTFVTSDGKMISKEAWGALPTGLVEEEEEEASSSEEEESDDMQDSDEAEEETEEGQATVVDGTKTPGMQSILPPPPTAPPVNLRKQDGDETPAPPPPKALYQVLDQNQAQQEQGAVFSSQVTYSLPPAGAESVLAKDVSSKNKAAEDGNNNKRKGDDDKAEEDLGKNFKF